MSRPRARTGAGAAAAPAGRGTPPAGGAGWEVERRWLVSVEEGLWGRLPPGTPLRQGYLRTGDPSVRIRLGEPRGPVLTSKSGSGIRRREVEAVLPDELAATLLSLAGDRVVEKLRHRVGPWELDRFLGDLEGLVVLEIELEQEDAPLPTFPEGLSVVSEVTKDNRFTSSALASLEPRGRRALAAQLGAGGAL